MRRVAMAIGLVALLVPVTGASAVAAASTPKTHVVHTGAKCKSLSTYTDYQLSVSTYTMGKCSNAKATGGAGTMPFDFDSPYSGPVAITWHNGKSTTVNWSWALDLLPDEHESKAHSCTTIPPGWSYAGSETDFNGTVTADTTGAFPVGSSVSGELCWFLNDGALFPEPGSKLIFG